MERDTAIVLVSGGLDSCVTAAIASRIHTMAFLHANYGQRTEGRELRAFHAIADFYRVRQRLVVTLDHLKAMGGSSLTDKRMEVPKADLQRKGIPSSYVPFRNANFLSAAVSWGEILPAQKIYIGAVEEDSSGYPDCRREFYKAFNAAIRLGTRPGSSLEIITPVIGMDKAEIVRTGDRLHAPFELTWSCYQNEEIACGTCDSCALRLRGFERAGVVDPLPYLAKPHY